MGELHGHAAADPLADNVDGRQAQVVEQALEILAEAAQRPGVVGRRYAGLAKASEVGPDQAEASGQARHPGKPGFAGIRYAVDEQDRFRARPRVGIIIVLIVQGQAVVDTSLGHSCAPCVPAVSCL